MNDCSKTADGLNLDTMCDIHNILAYFHLLCIAFWCLRNTVFPVQKNVDLSIEKADKNSWQLICCALDGLAPCESEKYICH